MIQLKHLNERQPTCACLTLTLTHLHTTFSISISLQEMTKKLQLCQEPKYDCRFLPVSYCLQVNKSVLSQTPDNLLCCRDGEHKSAAIYTQTVTESMLCLTMHKSTSVVSIFPLIVCQFPQYSYSTQIFLVIYSPNIPMNSHVPFHSDSTTYLRTRCNRQ